MRKVDANWEDFTANQHLPQIKYIYICVKKTQSQEIVRVISIQRPIPSFPYQVRS